MHKTEVNFCPLQSRSGPVGTQVQQGGLETPCFYRVFVEQAPPGLKHSLKEKLSAACNRNVDGTAV